MTRKTDTLVMAQRIQAIARDTLAGVQATMDREMWPVFAREVIWEAIAQEAQRRARQ